MLHTHIVNTLALSERERVDVHAVIVCSKAAHTVALAARQRCRQQQQQQKQQQQHQMQECLIAGAERTTTY